MNLLLNIIWVVFGGLMIAIEYIISSLLMMLTIVGIPFGLQTSIMYERRNERKSLLSDACS